MISLIKAIKDKAHNVSALESLRTAVHSISAPQHASNDTARGQAEGTEITYNPRLIIELIDEHKMLMAQLIEIEKAFAENNHKKLHQKLEAFNTSLGDHMLKKNIKLYIYMQYSMKQAKQANVDISTYKRGMTAVGRHANSFLNNHEKSVQKGRIKPSFGEELEAIINEFASHTDNEKSELYPYYLPPDAYA